LNGVVTSELIARLRADLDAARFTVPTLTQIWGEDADAALHRGHRVPARRALDARKAAGDAAPADVLARLFVLGLPVPVSELADALPSLGVDGAGVLGLVAPDAPSGNVLAGVDLRPYSFTDAAETIHWWIASDLGEIALGHALTENHVLGVGGASLTLSGLMIHEPVDSVLDLGTGCGIQALHASRHARRVVATDISARALEFAALNASLNGITGIEFRLGSLFDPVAGELFDQIVSNPPFVITPRAEGVPSYEYRDGEDAFVRVGAWIDAARSGTVATSGDDASRAISGDLDAWVIEREVQDAALYAETWIRDGGTRAGDEFDALSDAWLDDFTRRGVSGVGFGYITLRRPLAGPPTLRRLERLGAPVVGGLGEHFGHTLIAHDWQLSLDDALLARALLSVAPDVTEERHYWPGDEDPAALTLRQGGAFARVYPMGTVLAAVVGACDGELSIAAICAALAQLLELREEDLLEEVLPSVRELVTTGFLLV
jgi:methylase of polypeptide subunit release factors